MFKVMDGRLANLVLTFYYSFPFFFITDFSHMNMLPYQTPGISKQALVFMRDVKMFASWTSILVKSAIFDNTPAETWFGPRFFVP